MSLWIKQCQIHTPFIHVPFHLQTHICSLLIYFAEKSAAWHQWPTQARVFLFDQLWRDRAVVDHVPRHGLPALLIYFAVKSAAWQQWQRPKHVCSCLISCDDPSTCFLFDQLWWPKHVFPVWSAVMTQERVSVWSAVMTQSRISCLISCDDGVIRA